MLFKYIGTTKGAVFNLKSKGKPIGPVNPCQILDLDSDPKLPTWEPVAERPKPVIPPKKEVTHEH